jgi:hypothetical protein
MGGKLCSIYDYITLLHSNIFEQLHLEIDFLKDFKWLKNTFVDTGINKLMQLQTNVGIATLWCF